MEQNAVKNSWRWSNARKRFRELALLEVIVLLLLAGELLFPRDIAPWRITLLSIVQIALILLFSLLYPYYKELIRNYENKKERSKNLNAMVNCINMIKGINIGLYGALTFIAIALIVDIIG